MRPIELVIVVPTYNEGYVARRVVEEWNTELEKLPISSYKFLIVDDGSTDDTADIVSKAELAPSKLLILKKDNSGHGKSCIWGYRRAMELKPQWILQIDSDGQCDPRYFAEFWHLRNKHPIIFGFRQIRQDGLSRLIISRAISVFIFLCTKKYSRDPNVPYRLLSTNILLKLLGKQYTVYLSNMLLTYDIQNIKSIHWISIGFRERFGNASSHKVLNSVKFIFQVIKNIS